MSKNIFTRTYNSINAFNHFYVLEKDQLPKLFDTLSAKGFVNKIASIFSKAKDGITSIRMYPFVITDNKLQSEGYLTMVGITWNTKKNPKGKPFMYVSYDNLRIGYYSFPKAKHFYELLPYTTIQLYLPYMSFIDLNVNEIENSLIQVIYGIDFSTGYATAYITSYKNGEEYLIASKSEKIGMEIPWGADTSVENLQRIATTIASTAVSVVTLGQAGAIGGKLAGLTKVAQVGAIAKGGLSIANSLQVRYERGGSASGSLLGTMPNHPYLIIKRPKLVPIEESEYARIYGKPLYESRVLAQMRGFTTIDDIHLTNLGEATEPEMREIENLLKTGVHL